MSDDKPNTFMEDYKRDTVKAMSTRIEALEAALRRAYGFLQDKAFTPDSLTHECTKVVEQIEAALAPEPK